MRQKIILSTLFIFLASAFSIVRAQDAVKPLLIPGDVSSVSAKEIVMQTKDGTLSVVLLDKTTYKRASAENPGKQVDAVASDISVGDKIIVSGFLSTDKKSIPARTVYLMTKADIASKQTKEQEQWRARGISGQVAAINPQTKEITVTSRGMAGETKTILTPIDNAKFRRYAQDSIKYDEAKTSSLEELKVGDSIRALGDKSADGATFKAEEIISGSFQTVGGTITAIDAAKNEITISDFKTKKPMTVIVGQNTLLRKFPAEAAQRMAMMQSGGGIMPPNGMRPPQGNQTGGQNNPPNAQTTPDGQNAPNGMRPPGGGGRMRGAGGIDEMLERFPPITVADLKVGDMIAFSSTKSANQDRLTAIKLVSGIEPFLKTPQAAGNNNGGRRTGADAGFTIPGLEGGF